MKSVSCILFSLLYFVSTAGINLNFHYCGGKIKAISFFHTDEEDCCGSSMKKRDCCKEKTFSYKVKDTHSYSGKVVLTKISGTDLLDDFASTGTDIFSIELNQYLLPEFDDPPDIPYNNTYLLNRVLLI